MNIFYENDRFLLESFEEFYDNIALGQAGEIVVSNEGILNSVGNGVKWVVEKLMALIRKIFSLFGYGGGRDVSSAVSSVKEAIKNAPAPLDSFLTKAKETVTVASGRNVKHTVVLDLLSKTLSAVPETVIKAATQNLADYPNELRESVDKMWAMCRDNFSSNTPEELAAEIGAFHRTILVPFIKYTDEATKLTGEILDMVLTGKYDKAEELLKIAANTLKAPIGNLNVGSMTYLSVRKANNQIKKDGISITIPGGFAIETKQAKSGKVKHNNLKDYLSKLAVIADAMQKVASDVEVASVWVKERYEENSKKINKVNDLLKGKSSPITGPIRQHLITFVHTPQFTLDKYVVTSLGNVDGLTKKVTNLLFAALDVEVTLFNLVNVNGKS